MKDVRSPERLFDQTALWLHRDASRLPEAKREILQRLHDPDAILAGKKVLIVDDDVRNIFAMTSMLERYKMEVFSAETGKDAIGTLQGTEGIDLVLMDIMLPEMDGYETMRTIRSMYGFASLADHRADRQGDERRSREMHRSRRERLHLQAGGYGTLAHAAAELAASLNMSARSQRRGGDGREGQYPSRRRSSGQAPRARSGARGAEPESGPGDFRDGGACVVS